MWTIGNEYVPVWAGRSRDFELPTRDGVPGMSVEHKGQQEYVNIVLTVLNIPTEIGLNSRAMV